jgi:hypothetical protein
MLGAALDGEATTVFGERYKAAAANLLGPLDRESGLPDKDLKRAEQPLGLRLPPALRDYYLFVGRLRQLNEAHNRLLPPERWFTNLGKLVFMIENQAVVYWGVGVTGQPDLDPVVFQGVNRHRQPIEWYPEHDRCSEFLYVMLHFQAVMGGLKHLGATDAGPELLQHFEKGWHRVGELGGLLAFCQEGQAACFLGEANAWQLYVGGRTEEHLQRIASELEALGVGLDRL